TRRGASFPGGHENAQDTTPRAIPRLHPRVALPWTGGARRSSIADISVNAGCRPPLSPGRLEPRHGRARPQPADGGHQRHPRRQPEPDVRAVPPGEGLTAAQVGRYPVLGELGRGGMGAVLRSCDPELGRDLALKVLLGDGSRPEVVQRFREEAQVGGQLQHPGVVPVYELGSAEDGRPYFTMKLVKGVTLAILLKERVDLGQDRVRFLKGFEQGCQAVAY